MKARTLQILDKGETNYYDYHQRFNQSISPVVSGEKKSSDVRHLVVNLLGDLASARVASLRDGQVNLEPGECYEKLECLGPATYRPSKELVRD